MSFATLGLDPSLLATLAALAGGDLLVSSQTGNVVSMMVIPGLEPKIGVRARFQKR